MSLLFLYLFFMLMALSVPIVFAMALAPVIAFIASGQWVLLKTVPQQIFQGIDVFVLLAVPFFILAGEVMNKGAITESLIRLANALVGHLRGGLGHVNIVASIFFAGLSGSAVADTSAIGPVLIPAMEKEGYSRKFATAVTAASSIIGPIIPPSIIMVIYAYIMQVSVGALFAAGIIPGLIMGFALMIVNGIVAKRRNYPKRDRMASLGEIGRSFHGAFLPLLTPIIIMGGILSGIFTPTEAAAAAAAYALFLSVVVLRTLRLGDLPEVFLQAGVTSATILLVVGTATLFGWIATLSQMPAHLGNALFAITEDPYLLLFLINMLLFLVGMLLDNTPAILVLGPIFGPTMAEMGVHPLHFAIIMCVNLTVGLVTPPVGLVLFVASSISHLRVETIAREMLPFLIIEIAVVFLLTYIPALSMTVPRLLGFL